MVQPPSKSAFQPAVTVFQMWKARFLNSRWWTARSMCRPTRNRFPTRPWTAKNRCVPPIGMNFLSVSLPRGLMRNFSSVVGVLLCVVRHRRHHDPMRGRVAPEFVGRDLSRFAPLCYVGSDVEVSDETFPSRQVFVVLKPDPSPPSHCSKDERIILSCEIASNRKLLSLCGSSDLSAAKGYLQYRFGRPGEVELEFPAKPDGSRSRFAMSLESYSAGYDARLRFTRGATVYEVFDRSTRSDPVTSDYQTQRGVRVLQNEEEIAVFACRDQADSPPWAGSLALLDGIVRTNLGETEN